MSKVVAAGVTVPGEVFEQLVDRVLPQQLGGTPMDYQFVEHDDGGRGSVALRIAPGVGEVDERAALAIIVEELRREEMGKLAAEVWEPAGSVSIKRESPVAAKSGKTLPFEPLGTQRTT